MILPEPIVVTGGTGFVGSHLVAKLREQDLNVKSLGQKDGDLNNPVEVARQLAGARTVFHLAATVGGIGANRKSPYGFWRGNLNMGVNVIEECIRQPVDCLVVVGTICSYPIRPPLPFREEDLWSGYPEPTNASYGTAKRTLQVGLSAAHAEMGLKYAFPIPTNMFGPREHFDLENSHVIPAMIRKFEEAKESGAKEVTLWGTGSPSRDFLYVSDAVDGLIASAEYVIREGRPIEAVNLGTGTEVRISDLADTIKELTGYEGDIVWDDTKPDGQPRRCVDGRRAKELFGWEAKVSLRQGLEKMLAWYRESVAVSAK